MLKVLHINDYPAGPNGGAEVLMDRTIRLLEQAGVVTDTFTVEDLPDPKRTPRRYIANPLACRALAVKLKAFQPDIVHLHNYYHVLSPAILTELARFRTKHRLRVVMTAHDYHLICPNSGLTWFDHGTNNFHRANPSRLGSSSYLWTRRWDQRGWAYSVLKCLQHCWHYRWHDCREVLDQVICPSRSAAQLLRQAGRPTIWLPHPGPDRLPQSRPRPERLRFVYAGRLAPEKGLAEFLAMLPEGLDADWAIIGAGPEKERYQRILADKGLLHRTAFRGRLSHEETMAEIAAGHVLVQPSRLPETYGLTLIEALAAGTNILVSNQGALEEMVESAQTGFVFMQDDRGNLKTKLDAINESFRAGTLNAFNVGGFLRERSEAVYVRRLLEIYAGNQARMAA